jgi:PKD repeat protein
MRVVPRFTASLSLLLLSFTGPAFAQYMFLDSNGDGVNDASDRIEPEGSTTIDIWVDTSRNRDGSPATCDTDPAGRLTINQWEVVLRAVGGTLRWGPLENTMPISSNPACFADAADTTDPVWYHNGWGGFLILDPGRYHVGRLQVEVATGNPAVIFTPNNPAQPTDITSFGSKCLGKDLDNTYKLGLDWRDADGIRGAIVADAGGPYLGSPSIPIEFDGRATLGAGTDLTYSWDFGDGTQGTGVTPTHTYDATGDYTVTLSVTDGTTTNSTWTTAKIIVRTPPVARSGGPYTGYVGIEVFMDGRGSSDANGDPLTYLWSFGDGTGVRSNYIYHTYHAAGTYTVTLTVSDGVFTSSDATTATIGGRPQHPPTAYAGGPYQGFTGLPVAFDGSRSYDADADPITYRWLFGDYQESTLPAPQHIYTAAGTYDVVLEVNDGALTTSDVTTVTIVDPPGAPPVANAGGPYTGFTGRIVEFDGRGSSDPDGDPISLSWSFGDGVTDFGPRPGHSYHSVGTYRVTLTVTDGTYTVQAASSASITRPGGPGTLRAFVRGAKNGLALGALEAYTFVQIEPVDGAFSRGDIDLTNILLRCEGSDAANGVRAVVPAVLVEDTDGNGVDEVTAAFRPDDLRRLLGHIQRPAETRMQVVGGTGSGAYSAELKALVIPANGRFAPVVRPNPFNPQATVSFTTTKPGPVSAQLFDLNGRLVKTLLRESEMGAGSHDLVLDARSGNGETLASGIYFLRITGPDGPIVTRISVAK